MKDSGVEWIGEIPQYWNVYKMRRLGAFTASGIDKKINEDEVPVRIINYVDVYRNRKMKIDSTIDFMEVTCSEEKRQNNLVSVGDMIFTPSSETSDEIGISSVVYETVENLSYSYHVLRFRPYSYIDIDLSFRKYLCNNHSTYSYFSSHAWGTIRKTLSRDDFKETPVVLPSIFEQKRIADFLDNKLIHIDEIIDKTKSTIEDYKLLKQSIITEAVTKGLDKNVEMKDSGIEWVGMIPKHWEVVKIKHLFDVINERNENEGAILLSLFTALGVAPRSEMEDKGNKASTVINYKIVKKGDLIVNKLLAWMGAVAFSDYNGVTSPDYDVYRLKRNSNAFKQYYEWYFRFTNFKDDCYKYGRGIMMMRWRTYSSEFKMIDIVNPPYSEQVEIYEYLKLKVREIDSLIEKKNRLLLELETYKKSLVYEYVTGKKEVE
ncbi:type I restriction enzyme, S subunit [Proteiniclasticum ruminis]|uniref:Type I restriction enzyme, S subunit n=2 Tax=Proteiniclasticum ruminis TaxID=398199 RepID=A0A1G8GI44_9CLOT|nr:type I restriction enzyme, S subunit [Proteiniclasticum ruminis]